MNRRTSRCMRGCGQRDCQNFSASPCPKAVLSSSLDRCLHVLRDHLQGLRMWFTHFGCFRPRKSNFETVEMCYFLHIYILVYDFEIWTMFRNLVKLLFTSLMHLRIEVNIYELTKIILDNRFQTPIWAWHDSPEPAFWSVKNTDFSGQLVRISGCSSLSTQVFLSVLHRCSRDRWQIVTENPKTNYLFQGPLVSNSIY